MRFSKEVVFEEDLEEIVNRVIKASEIIQAQSNQKLLSVAFFDLVDSTLGKVTEGHETAIRKVIVFNEICNVITKMFNGTIVKNLGDGTLAKFENPVSACKAAMNIRHFSARHGLLCKSVLTLGLVEEVKISDRGDILGTCVDRCFRMEKIASRNQILIDEYMYESISPFLINLTDIGVSEPYSIELKGLGNQQVREIIDKSNKD